ncbi:hypothetical protein FB45DRAFT_890690 [Roridomyces roridus]|uniref:Uncharacterized protein n=1 Tax=Roridomyces roridus TaxID=1738132 RepID=A0AAD7CDN7_9AGAR|nr:hypothetical protein FB45DRAFT_890690 [Roridomyces roridus]
MGLSSRHRCPLGTAQDVPLSNLLVPFTICALSLPSCQAVADGPSSGPKRSSIPAFCAGSPLNPVVDTPNFYVDTAPSARVHPVLDDVAIHATTKGTLASSELPCCGVRYPSFTPRLDPHLPRPPPSSMSAFPAVDTLLFAPTIPVWTRPLLQFNPGRWGACARVPASGYSPPLAAVLVRHHPFLFLTRTHFPRTRHPSRSPHP